MDKTQLNVRLEPNTIAKIKPIALNENRSLNNFGAYIIKKVADNENIMKLVLSAR